MINKDVSDAHYAKFTDFLQQRSGITLGEDKRYLVRSRLVKIMHEAAIDDINQLLELVVSGRNQSLTREAVNAMTTNETLWFRDNYPFDLLKSSLFADLFKQKPSINIWSAACSSGQEPYSIAMTFMEFQQANRMLSSRINVIATDLSTNMISKCQKGEYDGLSLSRGGLTPERKTQFFDSVGDGVMRVKPDIQRMIRFQAHNLIENAPPQPRFDMIFCRNVLIYFSAQTKLKILQQFAACLSPGGIMFLGASESLGDANQYFSLIRCNPGLYYKKK